MMTYKDREKIAELRQQITDANRRIAYVEGRLRGIPNKIKEWELLKIKSAKSIKYCMNTINKIINEDFNPSRSSM